MTQRKDLYRTTTAQSLATCVRIERKFRENLSVEDVLGLVIFQKRIHQTFTSARWAILQTCSHVLLNDVDIFSRLFERFLPILSLCQTASAEIRLMTEVQIEFHAIKSLLERGKTTLTSVLLSSKGDP